MLEWHHVATSNKIMDWSNKHQWLLNLAEKLMGISSSRQTDTPWTYWWICYFSKYVSRAVKGQDFILFASQQSNLPQFHGSWWLICSVNLTGAGGAQIFGYTLFLGVSVRVFLDEVNVWISRLSKAESPPQCCGAPSDLSMAWIK